jgi:hypothetical protein
MSINIEQHYYYYYYYYLLQVSFLPVTIVLTLVQTKQIRIKYTLTKQYKNTVQTIQKHSTNNTKTR